MNIFKPIVEYFAKKVTDSIIENLKENNKFKDLELKVIELSNKQEVDVYTVLSRYKIRSIRLEIECIDKDKERWSVYVESTTHQGVIKELKEFRFSKQSLGVTKLNLFVHYTSHVDLCKIESFLPNYGTFSLKSFDSVKDRLLNWYKNHPELLIK